MNLKQLVSLPYQLFFFLLTPLGDLERRGYGLIYLGLIKGET